MNHLFNVEYAKKYGMLEAVLINNFEYWIAKNKANEMNCYDGKYWVYNSAKALEELFPYANEQQIKRALKHLRDENVLITGNYNKSAYDKTLWYTFSDTFLSIVQNETIDSSNLTNREFKNDQPIPNINTNNIPPIIPPRGDASETKDACEPSEEEKLEHNFQVLWKAYPRKLGIKSARKHYQAIIKSKKLTNQEMMSAINRYKREIEQKNTKIDYVMYGSTFFCSGIYDYLEDDDDG